MTLFRVIIATRKVTYNIASCSDFDTKVTYNINLISNCDTHYSFFTNCDIREWSEKFSASTIDGNNIGKIFFFLSTSVISIHVKLQIILLSSLFYTAV